MGWIILLIIVGLVAAFADSIVGRIVLSAAVVAVGLLLLRWITGIALFVTLSKVCAVVIVIVIVGAILFVLIN